jgi:hypothetical protein
MSLLKKIPITYLGELHDIVLLNFSVDKEEVLPLVPEGIKVRDIHGRALISMVHVSLKRMRPAFMPSFVNFNYRHIAFRLLVDDSRYNNGACKGIYFLKSFTNKKSIVVGGEMMTDYKLEMAHIETTSNTLDLSQGAQTLHYSIGTNSPGIRNADLLEKVGGLDRAYSVRGKDILITQILREKWPLEEITCREFQTNYFRSARLEACFRVNETIYYQWKPARIITSGE